MARVEDREPGALTAGVRIAQAAARLDGLDEPQRLSVTPSDTEIQDWVRLALEVRGDGIPEEGDIFDAAVIEDDG